ncbi:hypothetical protein CO251_01740 [Sulfobacillus sp. hq2]|uniref:Uncharacterized protein n=1 Tax=Sulfobacillus thermotolerans TaxID=338644 RepID=A0ABM6RN71_9FIRM|nr:hypothetical protein BXT84_01375 [Sulfobacillus thermotolerans]POB11999.1 hypothetical protein CO251_01740 [Sulfobacillus sp. hq2]
MFGVTIRGLVVSVQNRWAQAIRLQWPRTFGNVLEGAASAQKFPLPHVTKQEAWHDSRKDGRW